MESIYRDAVEELLDNWAAALLEGATDDVRRALTEAPDLEALLTSDVEGPMRTHDVGALVEFADLFSMLGVTGDVVGDRALDVALACYREVDRWPQPWAPAALRSHASRSLARGSRAHPMTVAAERDALRHVRASPPELRLWRLGEQHAQKLALEWSQGIEGIAAGEWPSFQGPARLAMDVARGVPELGVVIAVAVRRLHVGFVETSAFTDPVRDQVARAFVRLFEREAHLYARYLRAEENTQDPYRRSAIAWTLPLLEGR